MTTPNDYGHYGMTIQWHRIGATLKIIRAEIVAGDSLL
jgi:hypothetical protein